MPRVYSEADIARCVAMGKAHWKGGKPKCLICAKQLVNYDASYCKKHAHVGSRNHFYGKKHTEKTKGVIKEKLKKIYNDPTKTPNWKGGITSLYDSIRGLPESKQWKIRVFIRDNRTCQECGIVSKTIEAHHIIPFSKILNEFVNYYNQFSVIEDKETLVRLSLTHVQFWDINNGKTLCKMCHEKTFTKE